MKLNVRNFSKIEQANILIDGITVIAGENNTGKSTIGKILFSVFNSISDIEGKITKQRKKEIENICRLIFHNNIYRRISQAVSLRNFSIVSKRISDRIINRLNENQDVNREIISEIITDELPNIFFGSGQLEQEEIVDIIDVLVDKITDIIALSDETITLEVLSRYFNSVFNNQINSLVQEPIDAALALEIKDKTININFINNKCSNFSTNIAIMHQAIYIDNPFVIDQLPNYQSSNILDDYLIDLLTDKTQDDIMEGIIESVLTKEKLNEVYQALSIVIEGKIVEKQENEYYLEREGFAEPIFFSNLSTGLKSFVILKMLIEKNALKEKDVLILDEPEIHLHPQWQVAYAELVVLLQKYFNLSIVVTTHSPYFLDAINLFSIKHGIDQKVNYYLSLLEDNKVKMQKVSDNINLIYEKMATPIQLLNSLRYELDNVEGEKYDRKYN